MGEIAELPVEIRVLGGQLAYRSGQLGLVMVMVMGLGDLACGWLIRCVPVIGRSVKGHVSRLRSLVAYC